MTVKKIWLTLGMAFLVGVTGVVSQESRGGEYKGLSKEIAALAAGKRAVLGVSVLDDGGNVVAGVNDSVAFPMLSVFKFPCALAVLDKMNRENISRDSCIYVSKAQLPSGTYSPLRERYPEGGISLTLHQLLSYSLSLSDNNACDILIKWAGGTETVQEYMASLGFHDIKICADEADMHISPEMQYLNKATPRDVAKLFYRCLSTDVLPLPHRRELEQILLQTATGLDKLPAGLPADAAVGHKTGSSDRLSNGMKIADNDAGFVLLPDGRRYYIAVFVSDSYETDAVNAAIIAAVSSLVYEYMSGRTGHPD